MFKFKLNGVYIPENLEFNHCSEDLMRVRDMAINCYPGESDSYGHTSARFKYGYYVLCSKIKGLPIPVDKPDYWNEKDVVVFPITDEFFTVG